MRLISTGKTAAELRVAVGTLRRWHRQGLLIPSGQTTDGHRRYHRDTVRTVAGARSDDSCETICYARVSSRDQLKTKALRLQKHSVEAGFEMSK
jgi:predicted site-specific integrase-resolvase